MDALSTHAYDVIHFAGHAWFDPHELFLSFGEELVSTSSDFARFSALILRHSVSEFPLHVISSQGLSPRQMHEQVTDEHRPATWHFGFTQMAISTGIGAFIGCFESPQDDSARLFGVGVHKELLNGSPIVDAVRQARSDTLAARSDDVSALQYVLSGHPGYCLRNIV